MRRPLGLSVAGVAELYDRVLSARSGCIEEDKGEDGPVITRDSTCTSAVQHRLS